MLSSEAGSPEGLLGAQCPRGLPGGGLSAWSYGTMAAGGSKSGEPTASGLMTIHSDPRRETDVKQHHTDASSKDGSGKGYRDC